MILLAGTAKGLIVFGIDENLEIELKSIHFEGFNVSLAYIDERINRWWVGLSHKHWGQKLHYSDDEGSNWQESKMPNLKGLAMPNGKPAKVRQIWCMSHAGADKAGELWLGTDPGALFHSTDNGKNFHLVESLWNHPSRQKPEQWFGAGSDFPFIHSILVNPKNSDHLYIGISCAGVFESLDGGNSWKAKNNGLQAAYLPNPNVEIGHDPHAFVMNEHDPNIIWQQNHCGIYNTKDGGLNWQRVSSEGQIPDYGFAITADESNPNRAWVIPVESDEQRIAPDLILKVFETNDFGKTWNESSNGLPKQHCFDIVLRQSFVRNGQFMAFGTSNGNLYYSNMKEIQWKSAGNTFTKFNTMFLI